MYNMPVCRDVVAIPNKLSCRYGSPRRRQHSCGFIAGVLRYDTLGAESEESMQGVDATTTETIVSVA